MRNQRIQPIYWHDGQVVILDQTLLPREETYLRCARVAEVADAICRLAVRGAPLLGIAAAYGIALAAVGEEGELHDRVVAAARLLRGTRPTARNLFWAIDRMVARAEAGASADDLLAEARTIHAEDAEMCARISEHGATLLPYGATVMTICNAGALATGGEGTALGVIRAAHAAGNPVKVIALETRPLLQGARLTMWELMRDEIPATMITDSMAGTTLRRGLVDAVIVGADRIALNGDTANKVGTYSLAVLAKHHDVPFHVAAPMSTVDLTIPDGSHIPLEERGAEEVRCFYGTATTPEAAAVMNPAFDVTPHHLITALITERGVMRPPYEKAWG